WSGWESEGERTPRVATLLWDIAGVKRQHGDPHAAEELQKQALAIFIDTKGEDSQEVVQVRESLSVTYGDCDRFAEATAMSEMIAAWRERHYGPDHPDTLIGRYNYSYGLLCLGRAAEATPIAGDTVNRERRVLGEDHVDLGKALQVFARALDDTGRTEEALSRILEALA